MLDTHKRSSANESALVGGSLKSSRVSTIEQRVVNRNVMLDDHRPVSASIGSGEGCEGAMERGCVIQVVGYGT
jgi:hypothetical protein